LLFKGLRNEYLPQSPDSAASFAGYVTLGRIRVKPLLAILRELEVELHSAFTRASPQRLYALLHPEFCEFGRSGKTYSLSEMLALLQSEAQPPSIHAQDFALRELSQNIMLLTYRSAHITGGKLQRHTIRSSIWALGPSGWQMAFHQGTPTEAFEQEAA
jgi:hypothetical protein